MRFVTIEIGCDFGECEVRAPEGSEEIIERTLTVDKRAPRKVQLCQVHNKELDEFLNPLLTAGVAEPGRIPAKRSVAGNGTKTSTVVTEAVHHDTETQCRVPDCGQPCKGNVGLAQHLKKKHQITIAQHDQLYPTG